MSVVSNQNDENVKNINQQVCSILYNNRSTDRNKLIVFKSIPYLLL